MTVEPARVYFSASVTSFSERNEPYGRGSERNEFYGQGPYVSLTRAGNLDPKVTVNVKARGIRTQAASKGEDYVLAEHPVVFESNMRNIQVASLLTILPDNIEEDTERIVLFIDSAENAIIGSPNELEIMVIDESQVAKQVNNPNL